MFDRENLLLPVLDLVLMAEPVDAIRAIHNAFRNDIGRIDAAALDSAKGKEGLAATIERFRFFNERDTGLACKRRRVSNLSRTGKCRSPGC